MAQSTFCFQMLAFLLRKKSRLISSRTFQLLLSITGSMELGCSASVLNLSAFQDLLCDFEVAPSLEACSQDAVFLMVLAG